MQIILYLIYLTTEKVHITGSIIGKKMVTFSPPKYYGEDVQSLYWILHIYEN